MTFTPYQIDYSVKNQAKTLGFSKKKVHFKFGVANAETVRQGLTGAECRGSEHEVSFLWSLKTGKRVLLLDNKEVHYSESGQNGWTTDRAWQHVFTIRDSAGGPLRCHFISQPVNKEVPGSKPFDLRVAGVSYFSFNQIFQLGTPSMVTREQARPHHHGDSGGQHGHGRDSPISPEERRLIAQAKLESLRDVANQKDNLASSGVTAPMARDEGSLISFDDPTPPTPVAVGGAGQYKQYASSLTLDPAFNSSGSGGYGGWAAPVQQQQQQEQQQPVPAYGQPPPPGDGNAMALTTYQTPGGQPAPYVDSMGRMAMGPQGGQPSNAYGYSPQNQQQQQPPLTSPSGQSYSSMASYGSAPSFAQPPRPPQQQQPSFAQPPHQYNTGYPPQAPQYASPPALPQQGSYGSQQSYGNGPPAPAQGYPNQSYNPSY
jgi:hypothetical protein